MTKHKSYLNEEGLNGTGEGIVNVNSPDFIGLQEAVRLHAEKQSDEQKMTYGLLSLRYQMETYVFEKTPQEVLPVGYFLKKHLETINVKNKVFAQYIGLEESNLSSVIKGRRKVNTDLAFKLSRIFNLPPDLWLLIQSKNELLDFDEEKKAKYDHFGLEELLKKAG